MFDELDLLDRFRDHLDRTGLLAGPGRRSQGPQLLGYFVLSLFFFPLALIIAYMLKDRTKAAG